MTCERVLVLAQSSSSHCSLSMCQVSFDSYKYFYRYASEKLIITKIRKGNKVITCDKATILAFTQPLVAVYQYI